MLKKLIQKNAVFNPEVEADKVFTALQSDMPAWRWKTANDSGQTFTVRGIRRWHELSIFRSKDGYIYINRVTRLRWELLTLGVAYVLGDMTGSRHKLKALTVLREKIGDLHGNG